MNQSISKVTMALFLRLVLLVPDAVGSVSLHTHCRGGRGGREEGNRRDRETERAPCCSHPGSGRPAFTVVAVPTTANTCLEPRVHVYQNLRVFVIHEA